MEGVDRVNVSILSDSSILPIPSISPFSRESFPLCLKTPNLALSARVTWLRR